MQTQNQSILNQLDELMTAYSLSLSDLDEKHIIRIEKELKAQMKLDASIDANQIESIITLLREEGNNLRLLYMPALDPLKSILMNPSGPIQVIGDVKIEFSIYSEAFVSFLERRFSNELNAYVDKCIIEDHYRALTGFLNYLSIFPEELQEKIRIKLLQKLEFAYELIQIKSFDWQGKLLFIFNPFFYRALSKLGAIVFESAFIDLYNAFIVLKTNESRHARFLYASSCFISVQSGLRELLQENRKNAYRFGARESIDGKNKGGTYTNGQSSRTYTRSSGGGSSKGGYGILGGAGLIIVILLKILLFSGRHINNSYKSDYSFPSIPNALTEKVNNNVDLTKIWADQYDSSKTAKFESIEFDIKNTDFRTMSMASSENKTITLENNTNQPIVLIHFQIDFFQNYTFLKPNESVMVSKRNRDVRIYTGKDPEVFTLPLDLGNESKKHFRFGTFTQQDSLTLSTAYELIDVKGDKLSIISDENGNVQMIRPL